MLVKDILSKCLIKSGQEDFTANESYTEAQQAVAGKLLACINIAYREAAVEYLPLITEESVILRQGEADLTVLTKTLLYPLALRDSNGVKHVYRTYPSTLKSDFDGQAVLEYAYIPSEVGIDDEIVHMRLSVDILADGALAEYYFQNRVFDLASSHDEDFRNTISMLRYKGREIRTKERRWGV